MPDEVQSFFEGRSLRDLPGIGPKRATQLAEWGYTTADELYELGELSLARLAGERFATWFIQVVDGESSDVVSPLRSRKSCLLYTSPSPRDGLLSRMPSSA